MMHRMTVSPELGEHAANKNAQIDPDQVFNRQQVLQSER